MVPQELEAGAIALQDGGRRNDQLVTGETFVVGSGLRIPRAWDARYVNNAY